MSSRKLVVEIIGDSRNLEKNLGRATGATKGFEVSLKNLAKTVGLVFGARELVRGIEDVIGAAMDAETSQKKLGVAFKNTGLQASAYSKQIDGLRETGRRLGFTNTETNASMARLVTATGNVKQAAKGMAEAQDFARFKGVELGAATQVVTSAMAGNLRAIKQLGIAYIPTATAVDALKAAHKASKTEITANEMAMAKLADKQRNGAQVLDLLNQKIHGQAQAYSETTRGALARFNAALDDMKERVGAKLLPVMTRWVNYVVNHLPQIEAFIKRVADKAQQLWQVADKVAGALGGWRTVITAILAFAFVSKIGAWTLALNTMIGSTGATTGILGIGAAWKLASAALIGYGLAQAQVALTGPSSQRNAPGSVAGGGKSPEASAPAGAKLYRNSKTGDLVAVSSDGKKMWVWNGSKWVGYAQFQAFDPDHPPSFLKPFYGAGAQAGGKAGATRGVSGANRGAAGAPPSVINYAGKHRTDSRGGHGVTPQQGFDCSGYLVASYGAAGITIPHNTVQMYNLADGQPVPGGYTVWVDPANILPGDAVLWDNGQGGAQPGHVGIYAGNGMCWAYSEGSGAPSKTVAMGYLPIMRIVRWVKLRSQVSSGGAGPGGAGTKGAGAVGAPGWSAPGASKGGKTGVTRITPKVAPPIFGDVGDSITRTLTGAEGAVNRGLDAIRRAIIARAAAIKAATANVKSAFSDLAGNILSAFDAINSQWKSPSALKLQKMQAEDAAKAAADAYTQAVKDYGADSPEAQAAARALEESKLEAQAQAEQEAHDKKVKADKDALEKQLDALYKEAGGAKTAAQAKKIQAKITALLKQYGITREGLEAATDWQTAQTLFVSSIGNLVSSLDALRNAINGQAPGAKAGPPTSGGLGDRGTDKGAAPPPSPAAGRGGHPPKEEWWLPYQTGGAIPIIAHRGEYVLRSGATKKIGVHALNYMNQTGRLPMFQTGGLLDPTDASGHVLPLTSAVGSGIPYEIWRRKMAMAKYAKKEARISASRALYNPSMLPTPAARADAVIDAWLEALGSDALFSERLGALRAFVDSGDAYRGGQVSRSWLTYGVPRLQGGGPIPSFAGGGVMPHTGLAYLHKGETVSPGVPHVTVYIGDEQVVARVESRLVERGRRGGPYQARVPS